MTVSLRLKSRDEHYQEYFLIDRYFAILKIY